MAVLEEIPIQADTNLQPLEADYLANLGMDRLGLPQDEPVVDETPPPVEPVPVAPTTPEVKPSRPEAEKRVAEKNWKKKAEELEAELNDLRPFKAKTSELETSLTEFRTLAEQKEMERKKLEDAYRNEAAAVPEEVIYELPEVKEALGRFETAGRGLFPRDISDPNRGEPVRSFSVAQISDAKRQQIAERIDAWEKQQNNNQIDPDVRADIQHVIVSQMAQIAGVKPDLFTTKLINGTEYAVLPTEHPVYQHLARSIEPFVEARVVYNAATTNAREKATETLSKAVQQRVSGVRQMWSEHGVGLTGEALTTALNRAPDSTTLKAMKLLEAHPDLVAEIQQNAELEAMASGHLRPQLDLVEVDPGERSAKARALLERIRRREINAPMSAPLEKLALRQAAELTDLRKKLAEAEAEASRTRAQAEPGAVGSGGTDGIDGMAADDPLTSIARKLGLA